LVQRSVRVCGDDLQIGEHRWSRNEFDRIIVVGAGKAGTAMTEGLLQAIGSWLPISGWVNVPEGTEASLPGVHIHAARPAGRNEPTEQGEAGAKQMLEMVKSATPRDLCIALISGGGSALLPAPKKGITLQDKLEVTRLLSGAGADITELNTVRKHLSDIKGGGLLRACRAGAMITLVLSDVLGDPLDLIASGPTVPDTTSPQQALDVLERYDPKRQLSDRIYRTLRDELADATGNGNKESTAAITCQHTTIVIGNNALAVDEAGIRAEKLGYNHVMQSATACEGAAEEVGRHLAEMTLEMLRGGGGHVNDCLITGGEPTVTLAPAAIRGRGGRNQQLVLAAYERLLEVPIDDSSWARLCILSGGTDGEDGPTDAAGAILDEDVHRQAVSLGLDPADYLRSNDAYEFFRQAGGLLVTGPTGTNVCDLRVAIIARHR
jgi:glycerate-2-kinase